MRSASLLAVIAVLVIVGLLARRQLTAVRMAPPPAHSVPSGQPPVAEQVRDAVDALTRRRQAELERAARSDN